MAEITRRQGLGLLAALPLAARAGAARPGAGGLNALAEAKGLRFGSCFAHSRPGWEPVGSYDNPDYARLLTRDCGLLVPENEMKWKALRPSPHAFDFGRFDDMMGWAARNGFAVRGHNLLWNQPKWMPAWEESYDFGARPATEGARLLTTHITTVLRRYRGRIRQYDVVNETVDEHSGEYHETALSRAIGGTVETVDLAFRTARAAAPDALLVYNDYMSWEPGNENHRAGVLRLLEALHARGTPIDALGVQSHIATQSLDPAADVARQTGPWRAFLDQVTGLGLKLVVTELDVRDNHLPADPAARDRAVADYTRGYLDVMLSYPQLTDLLVWGLTDRYSWIQGFEPRPDGARRRPCPYDDQFRAKPMYGAIADALRRAPNRA